ncbi:helix-turn-helix transcriptional regulator [Streptomyces sp. NPDC005953]|uniref:helix-turn-helix transcriptional regulator n=1 Tax=Streptomyces sp. NPDC005953 TaxID=3156719 RepID=UPI0033CA449A
MAAPDNTRSPLLLLADLVRQRRAALKLTQVAAAKRIGLAPMTYRHIEGGTSVSDSSYSKLEFAFGFTAGACRGVLGGADSIRLTDGSEIIHGGQITRPSLSEAEESVKQAFGTVARLTAPHLTLGETEEMTRLLIEELRKRGILPADS